MTSAPLHTVRLVLRHIIAVGMMTLYLMSIFSPLASFAMNGTDSAATAIRECSGDCNTCGCSQESRAANICCCSMKRQQQAHLHDDIDADEPECCKKEREESRKTVISCGCPCGNEKQFLLSSVSTSEVLPFHFSETFGRSTADTIFTNPAHRPTNLHGETPTPPPKLA